MFAPEGEGAGMVVVEAGEGLGEIEGGIGVGGLSMIRPLGSDIADAWDEEPGSQGDRQEQVFLLMREALGLQVGRRGGPLMCSLSLIIQWSEMTSDNSDTEDKNP